MDTKENQKLLETFVFLCDLLVPCVKKFARIENPLATLLRHPPVGAGHARERCVPGTKSRAWSAPAPNKSALASCIFVIENFPFFAIL